MRLKLKLTTSASNAYAEAAKLFAKLQLEDNPAYWQGAIAALIACGEVAGTPQFHQQVSRLLNDSQPLPGSMIAFITNAALQAEHALAKDEAPTFLLPAETAGNQARLEALGALASGLALGIGMTLKDLKPQPADLAEDLQMLDNLCTVDPEADLNEDDFNAVLEFLAQMLQRYRKLTLRAHVQGQA